MNEKPYHNEPGYEKSQFRSSQDDAIAYNHVITHETLRVAVIEMLRDNSYDASGMPAALKNVMISHFKNNYQFYENLLQSNQKLHGEPIRDPFRSRRPEKFEYKVLAMLIDELKKKFSQTEIDVTSFPDYSDITANTLMSSHSNVDYSPADFTEDLSEFMEDLELDGSNLYESDSDNWYAQSSALTNENLCLY